MVNCHSFENSLAYIRTLTIEMMNNQRATQKSDTINIESNCDNYCQTMEIIVYSTKN